MNQEYVRDDLPIWKGCDGLGDVPDKPEYVGRGEIRGPQNFYYESLILAQNERWQRGLGMQVVRGLPC